MNLPAWWPKAALVLVALLALRWYAAEQRHRGEADQRIRARDAVIAVQAKLLAATVGRVAKVDTVRARDAKVAGDWAGRYQRLRDSLYANTGSGTITPPVIVAADSAVASCTRALRSCEASVAIRDTALAQAGALIDSQRVQIVDLKKLKPSRVVCVIGGVASSRGVQPGIGCGFRLTR